MTGFTYILVIWTAVAASDSDRSIRKVYMDWRPIGEFQTTAVPRTEAKDLCEEAAKQLVLKPENYRCVRSK